MPNFHSTKRSSSNRITLKVKVPEVIDPVIKDDDSYTMMHSDLANKVIAALNMLLKVEGKNGIIIKKSDTNIVISFNPKLVAEATEPSQPGQAGDNITNVTNNITTVNQVLPYYC